MIKTSWRYSKVNKLINYLRSKLIKILLGRSIALFVEEKGSNYYEVEVADSKNRVKLLVLRFEKIGSIRYRLKDYLSF
ncbi:hypothetical protein FQB35_10650 [Crassaminicella thermophila]|uniref:Uncharacterized protein n=1 Tax=Crassaminicella thermophila TaxID=2599308 RepID=A0A5C0SEK3_CRATE|nr:hypothetical protein [Crassaminicella thermophila]QEK12751.1 hypothetical protein FQB35_10650 [Crassaminicella thermophila]